MTAGSAEHQGTFFERLGPNYGDVVRAHPRAVGEVAMYAGVGQELLLGLLDNGMTLSEVVESLVMHGELPSVDERPDGVDKQIHLIEQEPGEWTVADQA